MGEAGSFCYRIISLFAKRDWNQFSFGKLSRLLILFSFFNFSGLNNGLTACVMTAGRIEVSSITPELIRQTCQILTSSHWKRWTSFSSHLYSKPKKIIEISSQMLLQKIFVEAFSVRSWAKSGVSDIVMSVKSNRNVSSEVLSESVRSNSLALSANMVTAENIVSFIKECVKDRGMELKSTAQKVEEQSVILIQANASVPSDSRYVRYGRNEICFLSEKLSTGEFRGYDFSKGNKFRKKWVLKDLALMRQKSREKVLYVGVQRRTSQLLYSSEKNSDEDKSKLNLEKDVWSYRITSI